MLSTDCCAPYWGEAVILFKGLIYQGYMHGLIREQWQQVCTCSRHISGVSGKESSSDGNQVQHEEKAATFTCFSSGCVFILDSNSRSKRNRESVLAHGAQLCIYHMSDLKSWSIKYKGLFFKHGGRMMEMLNQSGQTGRYVGENFISFTVTPPSWHGRNAPQVAVGTQRWHSY